ncbi:MAG TPA: hypothetical protein PLQ76_06705, partial [bacterium]|nr:hypothetical protein [bacterium]
MTGKPPVWPALWAALALVAGCTADIVDKGWQPMRPLGNDLATLRPPTDPRAATQPATTVQAQAAQSPS